MSKFFNILSTVCLLAAFIGCEKTPDDNGPQEQEFERYVKNILYENNAKVYKSTYSILLPEGYDKDLEKRYPVVYMLHGFGESGKDWSSWISAIKSMEGAGLQQIIYVFPNCND